MAPVGSLQCPQQPSTGTYTDPDDPDPLPQPISLTYILTLFSHLILCLPSGLFPSRFHVNTVYALRFCPTCSTCPAHLALLGLIILILF
jgi:hypothetical protein